MKLRVRCSGAGRGDVFCVKGLWEETLISILVMFLFSLLGVARAEAADFVEVSYEFARPQIAESGGYYVVSIEGLDRFGDPGLPVLPYKTAKILIPFESEVSDVEISCTDKVTLPGSYVIEPGQQPVPLSFDGPVAPTLPDEQIYQSAAPFPENVYAQWSVECKQGYRFVMLNLYPVEYVPLHGHISYYPQITVRVHTISIASTSQASDYLRPRLRPSAREKKIIEKTVDNPELMNSYSSMGDSPIVPLDQGTSLLLDPDDYEYVIITNQTLENATGAYTFQDLVAHKTARGTTATIVATEWIYANYDGTRPDGGEDDQTRIRNFIIDAYNEWGTTYVLLGGDGDGADVGGESGDNIIPARGFTGNGLEGETFIPADMYYACLDGTFDDDGDGVYGETTDGPGGGEVDLFAEVYVGRAPVDSDQEVSNFVKKTIAYENTYLQDPSLEKALMLGEDLGWYVWGCDYIKEIRDGSCNHGYCTEGFPGDWDITTLCDRDDPWDSGDLIPLLNSGTHLVAHDGHADVGDALKLSNGDVDGLLNDQYFVAETVGCYCGSFDNRTTASGTYTSYDSIAEHFVTEDSGAFAVVMNSRYGWGNTGSTDGAGQRFARQFFDAYFGEEITNLGIMNQDSKEDNAGYVSSSLYGRWSCYTINLLGDPQTPIGGAMGPYGVIILDRDIYGPNVDVNLVVMDSDLNSNPNVQEQYNNIVTVTTSGGDVESGIVMTETATDTGIFTGSIPIADAAIIQEDWVVQITCPDDTITATYYDADDGTGQPATPSDTAGVDCIAPVISNVQVSGTDYFGTTIVWDTGEASDSCVYYGTTLPPDLSTCESSLVTSHAVTLSGLEEDTTYYFSVASSDEVLNESVDDNGGAYYQFHSFVPQTHYVPGDFPTIQGAIDGVPDGDFVVISAGTYYENVDFHGKMIRLYGEGGPQGTIIDGGGAGSVIVVNGPPGSVVQGFTLTNGSAVNGGGIYCSNTSLMLVNCIVAGNAATRGGGICSMNSNGDVVIGNCTITANTSEQEGGGIYAYNSSLQVINTILWGDTGGGSPNEINLVSTTMDIRFSDIDGGWTGTGNIDCDPAFLGFGDYHLIPSSCCIDAGTSTGAPDEDIDGDPRPQQGGYDIGADEYVEDTGIIAIDRAIYPAGVDVNVVVMDADLNINPGVAEQYTDVITMTTAEGDQESAITMTETGADTSVFVGAIPLEADAVSPQDGTLQIVCNGADSITATYDDAFDGNGQPAAPADTAAVDCTPPVITNVAVTSVGLETATITWDTDEASDSCLTYGKTVPPGSNTCESLMVTAHTIELIGLDPDTTYYFSVASTDRVGNQATDDDNGNYYQFQTSRPYYVPDDFGSIQSAINGVSEGDTIVVRPGVYYENIDFSDKSITLKSERGPHFTTIYGTGCISGTCPDVHVVSIGTGVVVLDGFTIENGYAEDDYDGGVHCESSSTIANCIVRNNEGCGIFFENRDGSGSITPTVSNCTISDNDFVGIYCYTYGYDFIEPTITDCTINNNTFGGIVLVYGYPIVSGCTISDNGGIGGIYGMGRWDGYGGPQISDCIFRNNLAPDYQGGAIALFEYYDNPTIRNCIFEGNLGFWAGGIHCWTSDLELSHCVFADNEGGAGGIFLINSEGFTPRISNCVFENNSGEFSGAIWGNLSSAEITNCTIRGNTASDELGAGGLYLEWGQGFDVTVTNTILYGDTAAGSPKEIALDVGATVYVSYSDIQGGWSGTGNMDCNPQFVDSEDYHLSPSSCCLDTGTSEGASDEDIDGDARPKGNGFDIGADEYGGTAHTGSITLDREVYPSGVDVHLVVMDNDLNADSGSQEQYTGMVTITTAGGDEESNITVTETRSDSGVFEGSISTAVATATPGDGTLQILCNGSDIITATYDDADNGTGNPATPSDTAAVDCAGPVITNVEVDDVGFGRAVIVWDTDEAADSCVYYGTSVPTDLDVCRSSLVTAHSMVLSDLLNDTTYYFAVASTDAFGYQTIDDNGGQYYLFHTFVPTQYFVPDHYPTIQGAIQGVAEGDIITLRPGTYYETIDLGSKALTLSGEGGPGATIVDGAGAGSVVTIGGSGDVVLEGLTIRNGNATDGGGIHCGYYASPTVRNCFIVGNAASRYGGGIYCGYLASPTIVNCTISDNRATTSGGGIYPDMESDTTVVNSILWGDTCCGGVPNEITSTPFSSVDVTYSDVEGGRAGTGNIDCDPMFVGLGDYHLSPGSCCIDAATSTGAPGTDIDGDARPQGGGYDMGADEYVGHEGYIVLDRGKYGQNTTEMHIRVMDSDLNTNPGSQEAYSDKIAVTTTGGDLESTITITETGPDTGLFAASIAMEVGGVATEDGTVQITCSLPDSITATYFDDVDGGGQPATPTDTADVDCDPPVIVNVGATVTGPYSATITWDTDEPSDSCVYYGTAVPLALSECQPYLAIAHAVELSGLLMDRTYYFAVASTDEAGNHILDDNSGQYYQFHSHVPYYVPDDFATIQAAIDGVANGDVVAVRQGTYPENINFHGKAIILRSEDGPEVTIIDGGGAGSVVTFSSEEEAESVLQGFTITNGQASYGAGIFCGYYSTPTIRGCNITGNSGAYGGGIYCQDVSGPVIEGCNVTNNYAEANGGGILADEDSTPTIDNCNVMGNRADRNAGGIFIGEDSEAVITNCTISNNSAARDGGGVRFHDHYYYTVPSPEIVGSTITNNTAGEDGGGIHCYNAHAKIKNCTIIGNRADIVGGGIGVYSANPQILGCLIRDNAAQSSGGGIYCSMSSIASVVNCAIMGNTSQASGGGIGSSSSTPRITQCTVTQNSAAGNGGGLSCYSSSATVTNSIFWENAAGGTDDEIYIGSGSSVGVSYSDIQGGWEGTGNINCDPELIGFDDYHLSPSSCCLDGAIVTGSPDHYLDIDGDGRPQGDAYDIGADEYVEHTGWIVIDREVYPANVDLNVIVMDSDLNTNGSIQEQYTDIIRITTTEGDGESVITMTETGPDTAVFLGAIAIADTPVTPGDGTLQIVCNGSDMITATYYDASDGAGAAASPTDTAETDCLPPVISNVEAVARARGVTITWETDEPAESRVYYGPTVPPDLTQWDAVLVTDHTVDVDGLYPDSTYYYAVVSTDQFGYETVDDNNGQYYEFRTLLWGPQWAIGYGGSGSESANAVHQTLDGGYIVSGNTSSFGAGSNDVWVLKLDSDGAVVWEKTYGGSGSDTGSVQQTADGGYIIAGATASFGDSQKDGWIVKLNSDGSIAWQKTYGEQGIQDSFGSVQETPDGGYVALGRTRAYGYDDVWVVKVHADGTIAWQKSYGDSGDDFSYASIRCTTDGGYLVAGYSLGVWILKLDADGDILWQKQYGTGRIRCAQETTDGKYVLAGETWAFGADGYDAWILMLNTDGSIAWQKVYGGEDVQIAFAIREAVDGGYIVAGEVDGTSSRDAWLMKLDAEGAIAWQELFAHSSPDTLYAVGQTEDGGFVAAGRRGYSGEYDLFALKVDSNGQIPGCGSLWETEYTVSDTDTQGQDTSIVPQETFAVVADTSVAPQDSAAQISELCLGEPFYKISGWVTETGDGLDGVSVDLTGLMTASTLSNGGGYCSFLVFEDGNYTITPSHAEYLFDPASRQVTVSGGHVPNQNFEAIDPNLIIAEFVADPLSGMKPLTVQFTDQSVGAITTWSWTFGDGGTSPDQHPFYEYTEAGDYTVTLTVTGPGGSDTETKTDYIHVTEPSGPIIDKIRGTKEPGKIIRIIGSGFGEPQGDSEVHIGPKVYGPGHKKIKLWTDTKIKVKLPNYKCEWFQGNDYRRRKIWVMVGGPDGVSSNVKKIKVFKPDTCP